MSEQHLLEVKDLKVHFPIPRGVIGTLRRRPRQVVRAVDGVSLYLDRGEMLALVGESGCGKTTTAHAIVRMVEPTAGTVNLDGVDVTHFNSRQMRPLRREMQMIYQDPYESLDPRFRVRHTIEEPMLVHKLEGDHKTRVNEALDRAGLTPPDLYSERYAHELSGGQRQRVAIAASLVLEPGLLVADEPVSMLDVSVRAGILSLLDGLRRERTRDHDDHPRPVDGGTLRRPDRGDVSRPHRGGRPGTGGRAQPPAPLHQGPPDRRSTP